MSNDKPEGMCCPPFDPKPWEKKEVIWKDKTFIKDSIPAIFHIPLPGSVGKLMTRMWNKVQAAGADVKMKDFVCLTYDPSAWRSEFYMTVAKEVPDAENVKISGSFLTKVYDGPYSAVPKWLKDMEAYVKSEGKEPMKYYIYYTTCPKCAKKYGHNYSVVFAQIA